MSTIDLVTIVVFSTIVVVSLSWSVRVRMIVKDTLRHPFKPLDLHRQREESEIASTWASAPPPVSVPRVEPNPAAPAPAPPRLSARK